MVDIVRGRRPAALPTIPRAAPLAAIVGSTAALSIRRPGLPFVATGVACQMRLPTLPAMQIDRALLSASWQSWISNDNRERAGPWWLQWVWTLLFCMALAVPFTVLGFFAFARGEGAWRNLSGWAYWYGKNLVVCLTIGIIIHLLFDLARIGPAKPERVQRWKDWQRTVFFAGLPLLGVLIGWPLGVMLAGADVLVWTGSRDGNRIIGGSIFLSLMITFFFHHYFASRARQIDAERRVTEAQLRLLQAQIEPHFLFNTLANVQSLMDHDVAKAKQMLLSFTDYLRSSLGTLRNEQSTLAHELDLARNYLQLLQGRMADRLKFSIDADAASQAQPLPPLLLQPLIENAVVHGLEPSIEGGTVSISARVQQRQLVIEVRDDGRGLGVPQRLGARQGAGLALANIRERLAARYGPAATLEVVAANPGTLARLVLPLQAAAKPSPAALTKPVSTS